MILIDTGIIVATLNERDDDHALVVKALKTIRTPLVTTWPCLTEAMYLLYTKAGRAAQEALRVQIEAGFFHLPEPTQEDAKRACVLMRKYADTPMDFADASLVVAAEVLGIHRILTLDGHFYAYRIDEKIPFEVIP
jgi:predicted nucleic acid-binding protein